MTDRAGVVVAGGRSTRMGDREKAVVEVAGRPLVARVAEALSAVADELVGPAVDDQFVDGGGQAVGHPAYQRRAGHVDDGLLAAAAATDD